MVHRMIRRVECPPRAGKGSALAADQCVAEAFRLCLRKRALSFGFACERSHRYAPQIAGLCDRTVQFLCGGIGVRLVAACRSEDGRVWKGVGQVVDISVVGFEYKKK